MKRIKLTSNIYHVVGGTFIKRTHSHHSIWLKVSRNYNKSHILLHLLSIFVPLKLYSGSLLYSCSLLCSEKTSKLLAILSIYSAEISIFPQSIYVAPLMIVYSITNWTFSTRGVTLIHCSYAMMNTSHLYRSLSLMKCVIF